MADEELIISAKNEEFIRKLNECQRVIQATKKSMEDLYDVHKKGFSDMRSADEYTKKMEALKKTMNDVQSEQDELIESSKKTGDAIEETGEKTESTSKQLTNFATKVGLITAAVTLLLKFLREVAGAFIDTAKGAGIATKASLIWKQAVYELATGFKGQSASIKELNKLGDEMNKLRAMEIDNLIENSELQSKYNKLIDEAANQSTSYAVRKEKLNEAESIYTKLIDNQLEILRAQIRNTQTLANLQPENLELKKQLIELQIQENELIEKGRKAQERINDIRSAGYQRDKQKFFEYLDSKLRQEEKYQSLRQKLLDNAEKSEIKTLTGQAKLEAQREFTLKQLAELRKEIAEVGKITPEIAEAFDGLGRDAAKAFNTGFADLIKIDKERTEDFIVSAILGTIPDDLPGIVYRDVIAEKKKIEGEAKERQRQDSPFSFWNLLGLDPSGEEDEAMISALEESADKVQNIFEDILDQRVEVATRQRELLDTQIAETQREIELESELYQEGFANNLSARQAYLEELKQQRQEAIREEEEAIKKQQTYEKIIQTTSLLTSVAQILKSATKAGIVGLALAPFAIATLWAIWGRAKTQGATLAEGGSGSDTGLITGKRHSEGGERFLDHVEVERGEAWGVLSRPASQKYGEVFHDMVSSFNKDKMPNFMPVTNQVRVENSGPNSRLDKVNSSINKLNQSLMSQTQVSISGNKKIIKKGNTVRIVG